MKDFIMGRMQHKLFWNNQANAWLREVSDNDGGHTAHYLAAMCVKYADTGDESARREAVDDHQADIGTELARRGLCTFCEVDELDAAMLRTAAARRVERLTDVPPFDLGPDR